ncbi:MAG: metallophosphatase family protein [Oscillospiraceae bacterium]|nr:metallophosphatase family protein [Oscillospiraceae bacterium]
MKIAVLSDIHGNNMALDAVIADIQQQNADHIFILGDMISDFAQATKEILHAVRRLSAYVIRGNREGYMLANADGAFGDEWRRFDQFSTNLQTYRQLDADDFAYLRALPKQMAFSFERFSVRTVHGSPFSESDAIMDGADDLIARSAAAIAEDILLCGHTHRPLIRRIGDKTVVNVGSVGLNFSQNRCAQYTVIEQNGNDIRLDMRNVPYDFHAFQKTCDTSSIWVRLCLKTMEAGLKNGVDYNVAFLEAAHARCGIWPIPNAVWRQLAEEWIEKGIA